MALGHKFEYSHGVSGNKVYKCQYCGEAYKVFDMGYTQPPPSGRCIAREKANKGETNVLTDP